MGVTFWYTIHHRRRDLLDLFPLVTHIEKTVPVRERTSYQPSGGRVVKEG